MNSPISETHPDTGVTVHTCPLCGALLDPAWPHVLCPLCQADEAEKWDDYWAEREQAWRPI